MLCPFKKFFSKKRVRVIAGGSFCSRVCDNDRGYVNKRLRAALCSCFANHTSLLWGSAGGIGETIITLKTFAVRLLIPWQHSVEIPKQLRCRFTRVSAELSWSLVNLWRVAAGLGTSTVQKNPKLWPVPGCSGTYVQWIGASQIQCLQRGVCINKVMNHKTWTQFLVSSSSWRLRCFGRVVMGNHCSCWTCFIERTSVCHLPLGLQFFGCNGLRASLLQGLGST